MIIVNNAWYGYNFRLNLARTLKSLNYKVYFVMPYDLKYTQLIQSEFEVKDINIDAKGINPLKDIRTILDLFRMYKKVKPDIILNFTIKPNIYSSLVAGLLKIKSISNITGLGTIFINETLITKIAKFLYKKALGYNAKVFFQNSDDKELFISNNLISKNKTDLLPGSGVDLQKFKPLNRENNKDKFVFLLIARLLKDKGVIELIEATKIIKNKYQNIEVHFLGAVGVQNNTAVTNDELKSWTDNNIVKYLGTTDNVQTIIANVDCVILPSYREGTPRCLLEACAMEKPIIATNVVGCKEVVDDEINGFLCEVRSANDLALKMEKMINLTQEERGKMGKAARKKIIDIFDEQIVIKKYISAIEKII